MSVCQEVGELGVRGAGVEDPAVFVSDFTCVESGETVARREVRRLELEGLPNGDVVAGFREGSGGGGGGDQARLLVDPALKFVERRGVCSVAS